MGHLNRRRPREVTIVTCREVSSRTRLGILYQDVFAQKNNEEMPHLCNHHPGGHLPTRFKFDASMDN